jgi:hypothetical protein
MRKLHIRKPFFIPHILFAIDVTEGETPTIPPFLSNDYLQHEHHSRRSGSPQQLPVNLRHRPFACSHAKQRLSRALGVRRLAQLSSAKSPRRGFPFAHSSRGQKPTQKPISFRILSNSVHSSSLAEPDRAESGWRFVRARRLSAETRNRYPPTRGERKRKRHSRVPQRPSGRRSRGLSTPSSAEHVLGQRSRVSGAESFLGSGQRKGNADWVRWPQMCPPLPLRTDW